jgi:predicted small secreted protein
VFRKKNTDYDWKAIQKLHNKNGYNVVVGLRNPKSILETKNVSFDNNFKLIKKNLYNDWQISGIYVYSNDQGFVGSIDETMQLYNKSIVPHKSSPENPYCQIGFSEKEKKWYAWRKMNFANMKSFGIGTTTNFGDDIFVPSNLVDFFHHVRFMFVSYDRVTISVNTTPQNCISVHALNHKDLKGCIQKKFFYPKNWGRGSWTALSLEDAREMAVEYAETEIMHLTMANKFSAN